MKEINGFVTTTEETEPMQQLMQNELDKQPYGVKDIMKCLQEDGEYEDHEVVEIASTARVWRVKIIFEEITELSGKNLANQMQ